MYSEARKLQLIDELIKVNSDEVLAEIEAIVKKASHSSRARKLSAHDFSGIISKEDALLMETAINEAYKQKG